MVVAIIASMGLSQSWASEGSTRLIVDGMTCQSCASAIKKSLLKHPEVKSVEVDVSRGTVMVTFQPAQSLTETQIREAVKGAGYKVTKVSSDQSS